MNDYPTVLFKSQSVDIVHNIYMYVIVFISHKNKYKRSNAIINTMTQQWYEHNRIKTNSVENGAKFINYYVLIFHLTPLYILFKYI